MSYTKGYTLDATPGGDTVKEAIVDKLDALGVDAIYSIINGVLLTSGDTLASKEYVDLAVAARPVLEYYLTDSADAIGGIYYVAQNTTSTPQTTLTKSSVANGNDQAMFNWITPSGQPGLSELQSGSYHCHIHANVSTLTPGQVTQLYFTLVKRATGGTETTLMTSEVSGALTVTASPIELHATLSAAATLDPTDRLVLKLFANRSGGGTPNIVFTMEGASASEFGIPANLVNVDHGVLAGLADDDHTQYALVTGARSFTGTVTIHTSADNQGLTLTSAAGAATLIIQGTPTGGGALTLRNNSNTGIFLTDTAGVTVSGSIFSMSLTQASIRLTNTTRTWDLQSVTSGDYFRLLVGSVGDGFQVNSSLDMTLGGNLTLPNNKNVYMKDSGGTARSVMYMDTGNSLNIGKFAGAGLQIFAPGSAAGNDIIFYNNAGSPVEIMRIEGDNYNISFAQLTASKPLKLDASKILTSANIDHGSQLDGLTDNDHTQYARSGPCFFASKDSDQDNITTTTDTKITFTSENFDSDGTYDAVNSKWTPGKVGYWLISFQVYFHDAPAGAVTRVALYKNGSSYYMGGVETSHTAVEGACKGTFLAQTTADTDYFELYIWTTSSGNVLDINGVVTLSWWTGCAAPRNWS